MSNFPAPNIFITGGAGFIGSALIRLLIGQGKWHIVNIDKLTYAGNLESLASVVDHPNYRFTQIDICNRAALDKLFAEHSPAGVIHLAAESHVDRSIHGPGDFIQTNINGTFTLLEAARAHWLNLTGSAKDKFRFHHVSTDEVFGSLSDTGLFTEDNAYQPNSPYSASKAASDHLVRAWHHTYGLPTVMTNCSNNYGPFQFPEKLIPLMIHNAISGKSLPIYGLGDNVRDWLEVDDHARALQLVFEQSPVGETWNIGGNNEKTNLQVVDTLCALLDKLQPRTDGLSYTTQKINVADRTGHDKRYAIDASKIHRELGWKPVGTFATGLEKTVRCYLENSQWVSNVISGEYRHWVSKTYGERS